MIWNRVQVDLNKKDKRSFRVIFVTPSLSKIKPHQIYPPTVVSPLLFLTQMILFRSDQIQIHDRSSWISSAL